MPIVPHSSYRSPLHLGGHFQTIVPSVFLKEKPVDYQREALPLPDGDHLLLDWARCDESKPSKELMIVCHGLCGYTHRHYCLAVVHAFQRCGIDALAWNYRGTGQVPSESLHITSNNSTDELDRVVRHAISLGYDHIYLSGFSMGANLTMLYLGREAENLPPEVHGGVGICGTVDSAASIRQSHETLFGFYEWYFLRKLRKSAQRIANNPPGLDITNALHAKTFTDFDNAFTAPLIGFQNAQEYYVTSSACKHLQKIDRPALLVNPKNDPLLIGECYPTKAAEENPNFFLEVPDDGGHCGFLTAHGHEWWPAWRIRQFVLKNIRPAAGLPKLDFDEDAF